MVLLGVVLKLVTVDLAYVELHWSETILGQKLWLVVKLLHVHCFAPVSLNMFYLDIHCAFHPVSEQFQIIRFKIN